MTTIKGRSAGSIIEGYSIKTAENLIFSVKGVVQPDGCSYAVLRYYPNREGSRRGYRKLDTLEDSNSLVKARFPQYMGFDKTLGFEVQRVPFDSIVEVYDPVQRLDALRGSSRLDSLQRLAVDFSDMLVESSGVPVESVGVTGSMSVGLHNPSSDLDLIVYGEGSCRMVYDCLPNLFDAALKGYDIGTISKLYAMRGAPLGYKLDEFVRAESRKLLQGIYNSSEFFIRMVRRPREVDDGMFSVSSKRVGGVRASAVIADDSDSIFTPSVYPLEDVKITDGHVSSLDYALSFRGRFSENAKKGERVLISGTAEVGANGTVRAVLGNNKSDRLILI
ncbi:MAG: nucleotidyltransferase domain-containing protein [Candidatus Altiarchaeota archaeon]